MPRPWCSTNVSNIYYQSTNEPVPIVLKQTALNQNVKIKHYYYLLTEPVGYVVDAVNVKNECYSNCRLRNNHGTHKYSTDITVARTHSINGKIDKTIHSI